MPYLIGVVLGLVVALFVRVAGFDRDRSLYPTILIVIASYYGLFAILGGSMRALGIEVVVMLVFTAAAVVGFAFDLWWVVAAIAAHGISDSFHLRLIENPGVPAWWPAFCLAIDVCLAVWLAALLLRGDLRARSSRYDAQLDS